MANHHALVAAGLAAFVLTACSDNNEAATAPMGGPGYDDPNAPTHSGVASTAPTLGQPADPDRQPPAVSQAQTAPRAGSSINPLSGPSGDEKPGPARAGDQP